MYDLLCKDMYMCSSLVALISTLLCLRCVMLVWLVFIHVFVGCFRRFKVYIPYVSHIAVPYLRLV
jgi:hypothetical protein